MEQKTTPAYCPFCELFDGTFAELRNELCNEPRAGTTEVEFFVELASYMTRDNRYRHGRVTHGESFPLYFCPVCGKKILARKLVIHR